MHDQTAVRIESSSVLFEQYPQVNTKVDAGYRGLAKQFPTQVQASLKKPDKGTQPEGTVAWEAARKQQSSERICVEHANAEHKQRRPLRRCFGRREHYGETHLVIAGLVSNRTAER
ncbi:transposase [Streptomyces violascens]|uniref:transposase n=1 Tax=Streptomyces violascens TaxID=67381 RepID=UPI0037BD2167